jgi:hypothetical protein
MMGYLDDIGERRPNADASHAPWRGMLLGPALGLGALALAGCGAGDKVGSILIDPGHYSSYHCDQFAGRAKELTARKKELLALMNKASEGPGGAVIGSMAYRSDYESVVAEEKLLQQTAAGKNCADAPAYQSDQTIR